MISVVIPAYNASSTILRAIDSVLTQEINAHELEIIVVDDGSKDATSALVSSYASLNHRTIRLLRQENTGPAAARNAGVAIARGDYIAFLDADDRWLQGKLKAQLGILDKNPDVALVCTPMNGRRFRPRAASFRISFRSLLWSNRVYTSSVVVKKRAFDKAGGFNSARRLSEDYELWLKIAVENSIVAVNEPYLDYAKGSGISSKRWLMEKSELETYGIIHKAKLLSGASYLLARSWSLAKYLLRVLEQLI